MEQRGELGTWSMWSVRLRMVQLEWKQASRLGLRMGGHGRGSPRREIASAVCHAPSLRQMLPPVGRIPSACLSHMLFAACCAPAQPSRGRHPSRQQAEDSDAPPGWLVGGPHPRLDPLGHRWALFSVPFAEPLAGSAACVQLASQGLCAATLICPLLP